MDIPRIVSSSAPVASWFPAGPVEQHGAHAQILVAGFRTRPNGELGVKRSTRDLGATFGVDIERRLVRADAKGSPGEVVPVEVDGPDHGLELILLVGLGAGRPADLRVAGAAIARRVRDRDRVVVDLDRSPTVPGVRAFVEGFLVGGYRFTRKSSTTSVDPAHVVLALPVASAAIDGAIRDGVITAGAVRRARDLANTPSNEKSPQWLVQRALDVATERGLDAEVLDVDALRAQGFGGLLAVGAGSGHPPALVRLTYRPKGRRPDARRVVLVGKGITFDSGGLSLKPAEPMMPMKTDMSGAAAVLAAIEGAARLGVRSEIVALLAIAENMPSGSAMRPGDVITQYGGRTVEILNTDAEGRLVLADALAYADVELDPDVVVDVATLTGAASVGLGRVHAAMYASRDATARRWEGAAAAAGEPVWRLPLAQEYASATSSKIADLSHISTNRHTGGGSITAALFLQEFIGGRDWVHLDIAGPGRSEVDRGWLTKGGTGYGTASLIRWLESFDA